MKNKPLLYPPPCLRRVSLTQQAGLKKGEEVSECSASPSSAVPATGDGPLFFNAFIHQFLFGISI
jgi:hypothetical protein